jgi:2-(1,2-epoxy-1,2-dihydrophenyl)acetyl-CoA isomerase
MPDSQLVYEQRGSIAQLTLNNPERLNALSPAMREDMQRLLAEVRANDGIRALIITGQGRGFCSGVQLTGGRTPGQQADTPTDQNTMLDEYGWVGRQALGLYRLDKPIVAAVNGVAAGAGMSLATACDMRVGSAQTRFRSVFIERNLSPDSGLSFFLPRIVGYSRAADIILTSRDVDADEAYRIGLLDRLVAPEALIEAAFEIADRLAQWPPVALRASKRVLQHNIEVGLEAALRYEYQSLAHGRKARNDAAEARAAFIEKRKPNYTGT